MLPPIDIHHIADELTRLGDELERAGEDGDDGRGTPDPAPRQLLDDLRRLLDTLSDTDGDTPAESAAAMHAATGSTPDALLAHGLGLLGALVGHAEQLQLGPSARDLRRLSLPLTGWMLRRGAELDHPALVVQAAADLAETLHDPEDLAGLCVLLTEVVDGLSPAHIQGAAGTPARPWRELLLSRALAASRSHHPALMTEAFNAFGEHLPEDAPGFFRECLGRMAAQETPAPARELTQCYYDLWCARQRLH
jgi:hypothetical protein